MEAEGVIFSEIPAQELRRWAEAVPNVPGEWAASMNAKGLPGSEIIKGYIASQEAMGHHFPREFDIP